MGMVLTFPHCDSNVLHAPGECIYCDARAEWQELRAMWGINFTGHEDADKSPCPSLRFRALDIIEKWPGNRKAPR